LSSCRIFYDARYPDGDPAFLVLPVLIERIHILTVLTRFYDESDVIDNEGLIGYATVLSQINDIENISQNLGVSEHIISRVRQHVYLSSRPVATGPNQVEDIFFSPIRQYADDWLNVANGRLEKVDLADFKRFLAHEYVESRLIEMGIPFRSSNPKAWGVSGNSATPEHFGAHDIAPTPNPLRSPFQFWSPQLGRDPGSLSTYTTDDILRNIDAIVEQTYRTFVSK
jgi:hypothetical protein